MVLEPRSWCGSVRIDEIFVCLSLPLPLSPPLTGLPFAAALHPLFYSNCVRFRFPPPSPLPRGPLMRLNRKGVVGNEISPTNPTHLLGGVGEPSAAFHSAVRSIRNRALSRARSDGTSSRWFHLFLLSSVLPRRPRLPLLCVRGRRCRRSPPPTISLRRVPHA